MNDFEGLLATDYGFKPQGKSAPMAASKGTSNPSPASSLNFDLGSRGASQSIRTSNSFGGAFPDDHDSLFGSMGSQKNQIYGGLDDLLGGSAKFTSKSESHGGDSDFNFESMFRGSSNSGAQPSNLPVYDKPVYDDDIFDGVPGLKSSSKVKYDDVFSSVSSPPKGNVAFDDLLGGFGKAVPVSSSETGRGLENDEKGVPAFDDLIPGFGGSSPPGNRSTSGTSWSAEPTAVKSTSKLVEDPFDVSSRYADPLEEITKVSGSGSVKTDSTSAANNTVFDDMDPFASLGKSVPAFSSEGSNRKNDRSPSRADISSSGSQTSSTGETTEKTSVRSPERHKQKTSSAEYDGQSNQSPFDIPSAPTDSHIFVSRSASPPPYENTGPSVANVQGDMSPRSEDNLESSDDVWLTVSEIPLFTQPTSAPPPSRPPPKPVQVSKEGTGLSTSANARRKVNEYVSSPHSTKFFEVPNSAPSSVREPVISQLDELEDFAMGGSRSNVDEQANGLSSEELEMNSAAAAMKEAMDRAEAKFRHAREVREREGTKTAKSREALQVDKDEKSIEDERTKKQERIDRERLQREREEEEREQRRIEKEREEKDREQRRREKERERARELELEREKARQAVERATREARERAAAEARLKAERAAVDKANAEARERAERAAVQRAQAEARERAAAEARERAEKAAAEARERANAEAKEREARERAAAAKAEAEARARAERAAVERAAAEARERAAADARERAAAAARANQQKNENDLEAFFSMGRASSVPRHRSNPSDNFFDPQPQNRQQSATARTASGPSSSMRKASSTTSFADDLSSIFGAAPSSGDFQEVEGESEERRRARLERHQRTQERAAKALAEKNQRDLQIQRDQAERHRIAETLDVEIKRWAAGKEGNLRALLSTLQYVLWPECGWQPVSLTDLITAAAVKKVYRKATLCIHPDKVQQKGANLQQKYVAEKVFDILKEAWNKFNSEELF